MDSPLSAERDDVNASPLHGLSRIRFGLAPDLREAYPNRQLDTRRFSGYPEGTRRDCGLCPKKTEMLAQSDQTETHTLSIIVDNEPGVLARVIGLFSGRGYNIDSLTVSEVSHETQQSRITIVTTGAPMVIDQIKNQLDRLVPVHSVADLTIAGRAVERELALIKVRGKGEDRVEALRMADAFRARIVDTTTESFIFELTGKPDKIDQFVLLMKPIGLVEVSRTGVAAISRGPEGMKP